MDWCVLRPRGAADKLGEGQETVNAFGKNSQMIPFRLNNFAPYVFQLYYYEDTDTNHYLAHQRRRQGSSDRKRAAIDICLPRIR